MVHYMDRAIIALLAAATALPAQRPPLATPSAADSLSRCSVLADSLRATVAFDQLPAARPRGELTLVRTPSDAQLGRAIRSSVLVQPDGRADTTTVVITGTDDAAYRRDFTRTMARSYFHAPSVLGCRVWGHYWIALERDGVFRSPP